MKKIKVVIKKNQLIILLLKNKVQFNKKKIILLKNKINHWNKIMNKVNLR
jgi:hypothetical protein